MSAGKSLPLLVSVMLLFFCLPAQAWKGEAAIRRVMAQQERDWNQGDIRAFMRGYWNNDSMMFVGKKGPSYGYQRTLDNYLKSYPDARTMGKLRFELISIRPLGRNYALLVGSWHLQREMGDLGGSFSLVFRRLKGRWYIIADHTS